MKCFRLISETNNFALTEQAVLGFYIKQNMCNSNYTVYAQTNVDCSIYGGGIGHIALASFSTLEKAKKFLNQIVRKSALDGYGTNFIYIEEEEDYINENFK